VAGLLPVAAPATPRLAGLLVLLAVIAPIAMPRLTGLLSPFPAAHTHKHLLLGGGCKLQVDLSATTTVALPTKREHPQAGESVHTKEPHQRKTTSGSRQNNNSRPDSEHGGCADKGDTSSIVTLGTIQDMTPIRTGTADPRAQHDGPSFCVKYVLLHQDKLQLPFLCVRANQLTKRSS
jgi:hypothetical protein